MGKSMSPQALRWLRRLVTIILAGVILALIFAPTLAARIQGGPGSLTVLYEGVTPQGAPTLLRVLYMVVMLWFPVLWIIALAGGNWVWPVLTILLLAGDFLLAVMLRRLRRRLDSMA